MDTLVLAIAEKRLREYSDESAAPQRKSAGGAACERRLRQGIEAFKWIARAEETIRQAAYDGLLEYSHELDDAIAALFRGWLAPCEQLEELVRKQTIQGSELNGVAEFAGCRDNVRDWIERHEWAKASKASHDRRFQSEPW